MAKGTSQAELTSNSKKIKPVPLGYASLLNNFFLKFCSNFLKAFRINVKAFLGLVLPNQYCHIVMQGISTGFRLDFLRGVPSQSSTSLL